MSLNFVYKIYRRIFAVTVPVLHPVRSARGAFLKLCNEDNTPSMALNEAHLEGLFFLGG